MQMEDIFGWRTVLPVAFVAMQLVFRLTASALFNVLVLSVYETLHQLSMSDKVM